MKLKGGESNGGKCFLHWARFNSRDGLAIKSGDHIKLAVEHVHLKKLY